MATKETIIEAQKVTPPPHRPVSLHSRTDGGMYVVDIRMSDGRMIKAIEFTNGGINAPATVVLDEVK